MVKINWTRQSIEDIHSIRAYYIERSKKFTQELTDKIFEKAAVLENFPNLGRIVPEIGNKFIRELIFQNYHIVYQIVSESRIDIIAIHNGLRPLSEDSIFN
jgi:plasmid stabilization system protein ParE